ncbi:MAG: hypothetical protein OXQ31_26575 [Spirochaetaceae bacterium]|nr:hypothetical protein [Spirochaetaceae bacterium]
MSSPPVIVHADFDRLAQGNEAVAQELGFIKARMEALATREDMLRSRSKLVVWSVVVHVALSAIVVLSSLGFIPKVV